MKSYKLLSESGRTERIVTLSEEQAEAFKKFKLNHIFKFSNFQGLEGEKLEAYMEIRMLKTFLKK
ncbi:hypothetical protein [Lactococcus allomyrinae]|uniref:Uncharacterized protein n=1 Tax=Lactococcus allomyrinae TaxID=2419773 RepID=A0A387B7V9_9LACT|nr:hypothetical protein [Lactococcus allomyrinae]AYF99884.1 hypothetical protein D7I46_01560 [Lactococcus allomyrinae]